MAVGVAVCAGVWILPGCGDPECAGDKDYFKSVVSDADFSGESEAFLKEQVPSEMLWGLEKALEDALKGKMAAINFVRAIKLMTTYATTAVRETQEQVTDRVKVRCYAPERARKDVVIVFYHGGGWVLGGLDSHADFLRPLAARANTDIVAIDYGRAPEIAMDGIYADCRAALDWTREKFPGRKVILMGDSAGGQLALMAAIRRRGKERVDGVVAIYPVADLVGEGWASDPNNGRVLTARMMELFADCATQGKFAKDSPEISPKQADNRAMPPLLMLTAQNDILRPDAVEFAHKARRNGVKVREVTLKGAVHTCATSPHTPQSREYMIDECVRFINKVAGDPAHEEPSVFNVKLRDELPEEPPMDM